jgi:hypothetical protein
MNQLKSLISDHNGTDPYDDVDQRAALRNFILNDAPFRKYLIERFAITGAIELCYDPLGAYKVDAGIKQDGKLIGLIEVDYYKQWDPDWPSNYKWCHALVRKIKYWKDNNLPYLACTFSAKGDKVLVSTDEMQMKYMHTKRKKLVVLKGEWVDDEFLEIPLKEAEKFGNWTESELRRVS